MHERILNDGFAVIIDLETSVERKAKGLGAEEGADMWTFAAGGLLGAHEVAAGDAGQEANANSEEARG
mgnify:CR=1 FL=1